MKSRAWIAVLVLAVLAMKPSQQVFFTYPDWLYCIDAASWVQLTSVRNHPDMYSQLFRMAQGQSRCGHTVEDMAVEVWPPGNPYMGGQGAVVIVAVSDRMQFGVNATAWWIHFEALHEVHP